MDVGAMEGGGMSATTLIRSLLDRLPAQGTAVLEPAGLDEGKLAAVLHAARVAPSADNAQTWRFLTISSDEGKARVSEAVSDEELARCLTESHTVIALCGIKWVVTRTRREQPFVFIDVPIALSHMILQATELGIGCTWTLELDEDVVRRALGIPDDVRVVALVGLS